MQMVRLTQLFEFASRNQLDTQSLLPPASKHFCHTIIKQFTKETREQHRGGQLFLEFDIENMLNAAPYFTAKDQTLSVYGFESAELLQLMESLPQRAVDRIVPLGEALHFQTTWDGYVLLQELSREMTLKI